MKTKTIVWGIVSLAGLGTTAYFLNEHFKNKDNGAKRYGNIPKNESGGIPDGVQSGVETEAVAEPDWENPYHKDYKADVKKWLGLGKTIKVLTQSSAKKYAKELYNAYGIFNDNEEKVQSVFNSKLKDKIQVSQVAKAFNDDYKGRDLFDYLSSFLDEEEMEKYVKAPVRALPKYRLSS